MKPYDGAGQYRSHQMSVVRPRRGLTTSPDPSTVHAAKIGLRRQSDGRQPVRWWPGERATIRWRSAITMDEAPR
jgi:hypothetical protein